RIGLAGKIRLPRRLDEAEIDDLAVVGGGKPLAQRMKAARRLGRVEHDRRRARRMRLDALEAVEARHLLDQVLLDLDVEAVAGRIDDEGVFFLLVVKSQS